MPHDFEVGKALFLAHYRSSCDKLIPYPKMRSVMAEANRVDLGTESMVGRKPQFSLIPNIKFVSTFSSYCVFSCLKSLTKKYSQQNRKFLFWQSASLALSAHPQSVYDFPVSII